MLFGNKPDLPYLKVFGCLAFASTLVSHRTKFDNRAHKCVFLSYKFGTIGFVLFDLANKETLFSRNVIFYEHVFPFQSIDHDVVDFLSPFKPTTASDISFLDFSDYGLASHSSIRYRASTSHSPPIAPYSILPQLILNLH